MSATHDSELKQQGALDAAQNAQSQDGVQAAEQAVIDNAKAGGAEALQFDPGASPEQKAAQARSHVPENFHHVHKPKVAALASDVDDGTPSKYDLPTPTTPGPVPSIRTVNTENGHTSEEDDAARWEKVGWAPRFGLPGSEEVQEEENESSMLDHQTFLEGKLDDKFYGDWYHNTGVIMFACLMSWFIAILGGGLAWVFIIMAICGTYYRTSIRRVRRNYRDDVNRQLAKTKLETDTEPLEWINSFLVKFWPIYAPVLCDTIVNSVDQVLSTSTPAFLDSLRMKTFVLGTKPPRMEHVKTYPKAQDDVVLMDWKFSFTPNDVADLTARQIKNKINPKIVLEVRVGKGMISKGLDVIVEDMAFSGLMRVKVKLQIPFPHIEKVEICFLERPTIDYVCKPLGGETLGFDINFIPGLESFILEQIHANMGPMMYDPNVFPIEIAKMLAGNPVDQAIGVLQVHFHGGQGLKNPDKFSGTPDPYSVVSINQRQELGRTKTVTENANPRWDETVNVVITSLTDALTLQVYDYNDYRKDKELGVATFQLEQLELESEYENLSLEIMANGRARGVVQCDVRFFPVLEGMKHEDGTVEPPPESSTGIAHFKVEQAKDLDASKSIVGQMNPYAVLLLNGKEVHISKKLKRTNNPIWTDASKELLITQSKKAKLGLVIKDDRDIAADPIIGQYQMKLNDLLDMTQKGREWYNLAGVKSGRVKMTCDWKPVALRGVIGGSGGYVTPIGVMRLHLQNARDLRNVETMGKSDPYARVVLSGIVKGRTVTFQNNLNPDWDEIIYVPVHTPREKLLLEVMDEENLGKDRLLGHCEILCSEYIHKTDNGEYETIDNKGTPLSRPLKSGPKAQPKGKLNFTCSFYPTLNVVDPEEEEREESIHGDHLSINGRSHSRNPSGVSGHSRSASGLSGKTEKSFKSVPSSKKSGEDLRSSIDASSGSPARHRATRSGTISSMRSKEANGDADVSKTLDQTEGEQEELENREKEVPAINLTPDDLAEYESGLVVFKLIEGEFSKQNCYLEVVMDDMLFASYTSAKIRSKHHTFNEVGDAMVRELDFSKITLRLVEELDKKGEGDEDHVIAKLTGPTLDTLRRCLYTPTTLVLRDKDHHEYKVTVSLKYLPVKMTLDPSESFNNSGSLRIDVLDAADLPAADRNGYSDPYCKFILDGKEIFKTKIQKKTLHPAWNEFFEAQVRSRTAAHFECIVYDWDFGDKADLLGKADINLDILEPFQSQEVVLGLDGKSGAVRLKMLFKPDYVTRSRQGSSTFHGTFAAPGKVIGAPVKGVGKGAVFVGGGVMKGASFLTKGFRRRKDSEAADGHAEEAVEEDGDNNGRLSTPPQVKVDSEDQKPPTTPNHNRNISMGAASISSQVGRSPGGAEEGTASISIVSASGYPAGTDVRVFVKMDSKKGMREIHKTKHHKAPDGSVNFEGEDMKTSCAADTTFRLAVKDHNTFGSDDELGEATFFIDDQGSGGEKPVKVGDGTVTVRSSFTPSDAGSETGTLAPKEPKSPSSRFSSRRSMLSGGRPRERSLTPGGGNS